MFWFIFIASIYLAILVLVSIFRPKAAPAERRVALVIGNSTYKSPDLERLEKAAKDAAAISCALKRLGFEVVNEDNLHNLDIERMRGELEKFKHKVGKVEDKPRNAAWALVYYSGHGAELKWENYLIPIDAEPPRSADLQKQAVSVEKILECMSGASKVRIVLLDACRTCGSPPNKYNDKLQDYTPMRPKYGEIVFLATRHNGGLSL